MKFVFSSFTIGIIASGASTYLLFERLRDRRNISAEKFDQEKANNYVYQWILKEKIDEVTNKNESFIMKEFRKFVNENVVTNVKDFVNIGFAHGSQMYLQIEQQVKEKYDELVPKSK